MTDTYESLVVGLSTLFVLLAWVGWRFFVGAGKTFLAPKPAIQASASVAPSRLDGARRQITVWSREHLSTRSSYWQLCVPLLLVGFIVSAVLSFSGTVALDPLQAGDFQRSSHIATALSPEKLVPPPALPSDMFLNTLRPGLETADRDWNRLDPKFLQLALQVFSRMAARGYPLALLEGYRSPERQEKLADMGSHVTQARAFESRHQYGMALDAAPILNGRLIISERDPQAWQAYQALGEEAEKVGLVWGGRWKLQDYGHIEVPGSVGVNSKGK